MRSAKRLPGCSAKVRCEPNGVLRRELPLGTGSLAIEKVAAAVQVQSQDGLSGLKFPPGRDYGRTLASTLRRDRRPVSSWGLQRAHLFCHE